MSKPLRILLLASFNNPEWASVPLVGYLHSAALAQMHEVTLVTSSLNREALQRAPRPFKEMCFIRQPVLQRLYDWCLRNLLGNNTGSQAGLAIYLPVYLAFEWHAWRRMKRRLKNGEFDVVLRLTPVSPMVPSPIAGWLRRLKIPFVFGPINGGLPWPKGFSGANEEKEWISSFRKLADYFPYQQRTRRSADAIITGSTTTWNEFSAYADKRFFVPENGIDESAILPRPPRDPAAPLKFVCLGRLVPIKSIAVAIRACAPLLAEGRGSLRIVGDGPLRAELENLASQLGVQQQVTFVGIVPHAQAIEELLAADVLLFPSVRDFGAGAVGEALATGTVPVVANFGGPADLVTRDRGIRVPLIDEAQLEAGFSKAIRRLDADRALLEKMSAAGQRFARESLTWAGKATEMTRILCWVRGEAERPDLQPPGAIL